MRRNIELSTFTSFIFLLALHGHIPFQQLPCLPYVQEKKKKETRHQTLCKGSVLWIVSMLTFLASCLCHLFSPEKISCIFCLSLPYWLYHQHWHLLLSVCCLKRLHLIPQLLSSLLLASLHSQTSWSCLHVTFSHPTSSSFHWHITLNLWKMPIL